MRELGLYLGLEAASISGFRAAFSAIVAHDATAGVVGTITYSGNAGAVSIVGGATTDEPGHNGGLFSVDVSLNVTFDVDAISLSAGQSLTTTDTITLTDGTTQIPVTLSVRVENSNALPVNTVLPEITGTPEIGQVLSVSEGTWTGNPTPTITYQWTRDDVNIGGATANTYTLVGADDETDIGCTVTGTNSEAAVTADAAAVSVTYPAPSAAGGIADQSLTEDTGDQTVATASDFTGSGGAYSLTTSTTGITINTSTGLVTIDTDATGVLASTSVVARYTNSGGFADSGFSVVVNAASLIPPAQITDLAAATGSGAGEVDLTWTLPSGTITAHAVRRVDPTTARAASQSFFVSGHSLTDDMSGPLLNALTTINGSGPSFETHLANYSTIGERRTTGGSGNSTETGTLDNYLTTFSDDIFVVYHRSDIQESIDTESLQSNLNAVGNAALTQNSSARVFFAHSTPLANQVGNTGGSWDTAYDSDYADLCRTEALVAQGVVTAFNAQRPGSTAEMAFIPLGNIWADLYDEIDASNIAGASDMSFIMRDNPHFNRRGASLMAMGVYAVVYNACPIGYDADVFDDTSPSGTQLTDAQALAFQRVVWQAVTAQPDHTKIAPYEQLSNTAATANATITAAAGDTREVYEVAAINGGSLAPYSAPADAVSAASLPAQVQNLSAVAGDAQNSLAWDAVAGATDYQIEFSTGGGYSTISDGVSTTASYTHTGLTNGTEYTYRVSAINGTGTGTASATDSATPVAAPTAPGAPTSLVATDAQDGEVPLTWVAPASDGGSAITGYRIERDAGGGYSDLVADTGTTGVTYTDSTAANGTTYTYRVSAINSVGTGTASNTDSATPVAAATAPGAPTSLTATAGDAEVDLVWVAPASDGGSAITGYRIERDAGGGYSDLVADTSSTGVTYTDSTAANGTEYTYRVSAINSVGTGTASNTDSATPAAAGGVAVSGTTGSTTQTSDGGDTIYTLNSGSGTITFSSGGTVRILVVDGGASGAYQGSFGGGGGAGGPVLDTTFTVSAEAYSWTVGEGGAAPASGVIGNAGALSTFTGTSAPASSNGAGPGSFFATAAPDNTHDNTGGGAYNTDGAIPINGFRGGLTAEEQGGPGSGGASSAANGGDVVDLDTPGTGANGVSSDITGSAVIYGGGGAGGHGADATAPSPTAGGTGGGGDGATSTVAAQAGTDGLGGGGGGSGPGQASGAGGRGVIIIRFT